ncbi:hypothetical protein [Geitlerinema sp. PCC 9228]|nr:hypothetical protein [Geitlerinema sp. PCC 9228]
MEDNQLHACPFPSFPSFLLMRSPPKRSRHPEILITPPYIY